MLVLGDDDRSALAVVRSLGRAGAEVHVAACPPDGPPARSAYCFARHELPPLDDEPRWLAALVALQDAQRFDLVLPVSDDRIILRLRRHAAELAGRVRVYALGEEAFLASYDKERTLALGRELGLPVPEYVVVPEGGGVPEAARAWGFPLVCRPISSFDLARPGRAKWSARFVRSAAELDAAVRELAPHARVIVQRAERGRGVGLGVLAKEGRTVALFQHLRVHEAPSGSGSSLRRSMPLHPEMADAARKLAAAMRLDGVMMVELKWDEPSGRWFLVEINGRFWGSLPLAVAAGADFPAWLVASWLGRSVDVETRYDEHVVARNGAKDFAWWTKNLRADKGDPYLVTTDWLTATKELLVRGAGEVDDASAWDDPAPGAAARLRAWSRARGLVDRAVHRLPILRASAHEAARDRWARARSVVFLCHGNICRSPFAERLARRAAPDKAVRSAGFYRRAGRAAPELAVEVAREHGVELDTHRSRVVDHATIDAADLVVVFDARNLASLAAWHPAARGKTIWFGALAATGPLALADPFGGTAADFRACYAQIARALPAAG